MQIGKPKATYRLRLIDIETGKSKTVTLYTQNENEKVSFEELLKKIVKSLNEK